MIAGELLEILVCPEDRSPVRLAEPDLLKRVNQAILEGKLRNRGGSQLREPLEGALLREDATLLYPVRGSIPIMLLDESISTASLT